MKIKRLIGLGAAIGGVLVAMGGLLPVGLAMVMIGVGIQF
jgi:hypothetical protein